MKPGKVLLYFSFLILHFSSAAQNNYTKLVNPFIGTGGHGHTYPGASLPFGMMQLSPDTRMADWDGSSGYHYSDSVIYGFSHTHLNGTGIPDYCDVLFMPFSGKVQWDKENYRSAFSHKNEKATPGFYQVMLDKHKIKVQLATAQRSGMHKYQYQTKDAALLIDLQHRDEVLASYIEKISPTEIRGFRRSKSWAQDQHVYFYAKFNKPIKEFAINNNGAISNEAFAQGKNIRAFVRFDAGDEKTLLVKVGISAVNADGARANVDAEIKAFDFEKLATEASRAWNKELGVIDVKGGTKEQQTIFYTALYHTMLSPNIFTDVDGKYRSTDNTVHTANGFTNYSVFSLWDTYRAFHPLMTIINKKRTLDWINTFLAQYKNGGMLPVWELAGNETFCMIGYHAVPVIWDAYQKGLRGFDAKLALEAMTAYAESDRFGLDHYRKYGYIPNNLEHESVSKTLEYAYDDWCIAQFAKELGVDSIYKKYIARAQYYKNVFDPVTKKMRGKIDARWYAPFDAKEINNFYTEGNAWQYSFAVPQDIAGLIKVHGGKKLFTNKLEELFTTSSKTTGRDQADVTGLIGQYAHGNEPSHHMAYLFNYVGKPERTQELIHRICNEFYSNSPGGLIGNEDCGQMSAWYILSALGFYPVTPGSGQYAIGTPVFDEATIYLEGGKKFTVKASRQNKSSYYVTATRLNGKIYTKSFFNHYELANGGELSFTLSASPHTKWGRNQRDQPLTAITDNLIVAQPYFDVPSNKFKNEMLVAVKTVDSAASIHYKTNNSDFKLYKAPFTITSSDTIVAIAFNNGKSSWPVNQAFYKMPANRSIKVQSAVHPMYTAGGADALIDGIKGNTNWRSGDWQSYFDTDFEAVIDLQKSTTINYVAVHVLQDVSPWILYPKEVIFYGSADGKNFTEIGRFNNTTELKNEQAMVKEMGIKISTATHYLKVKAISGGKLPHWHESAGQPSHLFIDEIIIK